MTLEGKIIHGMSLSTECVSDVMVIAFGPIGSYVDLSGYYTKSEVDTALSGKQATLVSGTNIKTINNQSLLGSGNINIQGGGDMSNYYTKSETNGLLNAKQDTLTFDAVPTENSANPVTSGGLYTKFLYVEADLAGKADSADLASVATSGSYNDLSDKPDIPQAQVQSDWNESDSSKVDYIQNKPTIPTVPTNVSAFTNDAGYLTQHQSLANYYTKSETNSAIVDSNPVIEDTRSSEVAAITGVAPFDTLVDEQRIVVKLKYKTSANATLTLTGLTNALPIYARCNTNNNSGITPIYVNGFVASSYMELIYDATNSRWICTNYDRVMTYEALTQSRIDSSSTAQCVITGKLLRDNFYLKSEIDTTIGNIETLLASI